VVVEIATRESTIVSKIARGLKGEFGPLIKFIKIHGDPYMPSGTPDLIGTLKGRAFVLEAKNEVYKPEPIQIAELEEWEEAGAIVGIVKSLAEAVVALNEPKQLEFYLKDYI